METRAKTRNKGTGNISERSPGRWRLRYDGQPDANGLRRQVTETVSGSRKEAERVLRERLQALENGSFVPKQKETVSVFMDRWMSTYAATNVTLKTQQGYRSVIGRYIKPFIGHVRVQALNASHIQAMYASILEQGLSNTTAVQCHRVLHKALSTGVKWGVITRNVADGSTPPRIVRKELEIWDIPTIHRFLDAIQGNRFQDLYHFALLSGMRRSEICGLQWANVDLPEGRISVVKTLQRISGKGLVEGQPKTGRSRRSISLSPEAINVLHGIRGRQIEEQLAAGDIWENTGYVFTQPAGNPVDPDMVSKDFPKVVRKAGLPHLTLHGLRHAHASLLLAAGVNSKVVSERLGHSSIATTMDIYSHLMPGLQEAAALALDAQLAR